MDASVKLFKLTSNHLAVNNNMRENQQDLCQSCSDQTKLPLDVCVHLCLRGVSGPLLCFADEVDICTLYLSITQGAIPSQSLVSISDISLPNFTSNQPSSLTTLSFVLQQHGWAGLCSVLTL